MVGKWGEKAVFVLSFLNYLFIYLLASVVGCILVCLLGITVYLSLKTFIRAHFFISVLTTSLLYTANIFS